jgi:hypothetical protein
LSATSACDPTTGAHVIKDAAAGIRCLQPADRHPSTRSLDLVRLWTRAIRSPLGPPCRQRQAGLSRSVKAVGNWSDG